MIPATIHPDVKSIAERRMFDLFRDAPGTEAWVCLHSLGLARHAKKRRGEIDFLLLTRTGIFVLEVKGGGVSREDGVWKFTDRHGKVHEKHESPFEQAASAMFALESEIRQEFASDQRRSRLLFGYGVMFPDVIFDATGTEADPRQIYDYRSRRRPLTEFVESLAAFARERDRRDRYSPTVKDIEAIVACLRGDFEMLPSLGALADAASEKLLSLEQEQYAVLDALEHARKPRILIQGGAGTGKTLLAVEIARREARRGEGDVLLLCYNRLLARFLNRTLKNEPDLGCRIVVDSIYGFLDERIAKSPLAEEFEQKRVAVGQNELYRDLYPEYAGLALLDNCGQLFRTLIEDEAQDILSEPMLDVLDAVVDGGLETGRWWIFCDTNNQAAVFGALDESALDRLERFGRTSILAINRRNTKPVADETAMLTRPDVRVRAVVEGVPVKYSWYARDSHQPAVLKRVLKSLLAEGIAPGRITVLSPRGPARCCAALVDDPPIVQVTDQIAWDIATRTCEAINFSSISAFKGLENDFIVLTDIENLESRWWRSVTYVGMSRARVGLHLLLKDSLRPTYESCIRGWLEASLSGSPVGR